QKVDNPGLIAAYRWHIEDAIPFGKSIRFTIEHGNQNDTRADYSSVAYWYQTEPHGPQAPLLPYEQRLPDYNPPVATASITPAHPTITGDDLITLAKATGGNVEV